MDYETCSGTPSALGEHQLTSCLPAALGPTVFDCLAGPLAQTVQPKDAPRAMLRGLNT